MEKFFARYVELAPSKLDSYSPGHWKLTQRLEELGAKILRREVDDEVSLRLFLIDVAVWKEPFEQQSKEMTTNVLSNTYSEIVSTFEKVWKALEKRQDFEAINAIGSLSGFGRRDGSRKIASAVLRFLDPSKYGVVDYRNWAILSNTENSYFDEPLLEPLARTMEDSRKLPISTADYLKYLHVIRNLAERTNFSPSQIDLALFAYSDEIKPLSQTKPSSQTKQSKTIAPAHPSLKYQRMEAKVVQVINDVKKKGRRGFAVKLERDLEDTRKRNPTPAGIMQMCIGLTSYRPDVDRFLEARGILTIRSILPELRRIYDDPDS